MEGILSLDFRYDCGSKLVKILFDFLSQAIL